ncbi:hypothetical protein ES319_D11G196700v1 [Gossypium barbadense]|uniref:Uncharacterized protein n=1 Tax=Gossypium barbadense TaxID=3634 RepID=A0A5J5PDX0_GOSBA|nr:hypothetical protein ES319_D11G196700v1 [Gossypium barbadense]
MNLVLCCILKCYAVSMLICILFSYVLCLAELEYFKMEYANARLECNAADERANILASEVIGLEKKSLRLRSNELKLERQLENSQAEISKNHLYHWCIHQLVLIVRYYMIAMKHLQCIALEDTLLLAWETSSKPACRPTSKLNQISSNILFILFICNLI